MYSNLFLRTISRYNPLVSAQSKYMQRLIVLEISIKCEINQIKCQC